MHVKPELREDEKLQSRLGMCAVKSLVLWSWDGDTVDGEAALATGWCELAGRSLQRSKCGLRHHADLSVSILN